MSTKLEVYTRIRSANPHAAARYRQQNFSALAEEESAQQESQPTFKSGAALEKYREVRARNPYEASAMRRSLDECSVSPGLTWRGAIDRDEAALAEHERLMKIPLSELARELRASKAGDK